MCNTSILIHIYFSNGQKGNNHTVDNLKTIWGEPDHTSRGSRISGEYVYIRTTCIQLHNFFACTLCWLWVSGAGLQPQRQQDNFINACASCMEAAGGSKTSAL